MVLTTQLGANAVMMGDLNTLLSPIDWSFRQKINKETSELLHTLDQIDMVYIYRVFHLKTRQYTCFSAAYGTFSKTDYISGHKTSLNKFKKTEVTTCII
jgi:exonuclease III